MSVPEICVTVVVVLGREENEEIFSKDFILPFVPAAGAELALHVGDTEYEGEIASVQIRQKDDLSGFNVILWSDDKDATQDIFEDFRGDESWQ
ncbi:hypothetical protein CL654_00235 [bacterium]|mgnify:CR=1 FL=1|nr:hypothetical protein [bacterium]|tara:strand:- start:8 stop:286 length:279 start_codon:yes stop_codon:yes gene_type:complete